MLWCATDSGKISRNNLKVGNGEFLDVLLSANFIGNGHSRILLVYEMVLSSHCEKYL